MKIKLVGILFLSLFFSGCVSLDTPVIATLSNKSLPPDGRYEILGEVTLLKHDINVCGVFLSGGIRYTDLLVAARDKFRNVDDVVGVTIDKEIKGLVAVFRTDFLMRGIAIRYVKEAAAAE